MPERVQCAECADVYDSDEHPFCPRCGATSTVETPAAAVHLASRNNPQRRRVQAAGVMMLSTGLVVMALALGGAIMADELVPQTLESFSGQAGGDLELTLVNGTEPVPGVEVRVESLNGTELVRGTTDQNGTVVFESLPEATVQLSSSNWSRKVLIPDGLPQEITADVSADGDEGDWIGIDGFVSGTRVLSAVFAALSAVTVAAGVAAMRLRQRNLAIAGTLAGGLPWLLLLFASMNLVVLLVVAFYGAAFVFLRKGKALFTS